MTKKEFIEKVSELTGLDAKDARASVEAYAQVVKMGLKRDRIVEVQGFGTFRVTPKQETTRRNIHTGELFTVPAKNYVRFDESEKLQDAVNDNEEPVN